MKVEYLTVEVNGMARECERSFKEFQESAYRLTLFKALHPKYKDKQLDLDELAKVQRENVELNSKTQILKHQHLLNEIDLIKEVKHALEIKGVNIDGEDT